MCQFHDEEQRCRDIQSQTDAQHLSRPNKYNGALSSAFQANSKEDYESIEYQGTSTSKAVAPEGAEWERNQLANILGGIEIFDS